MPLKINHAQAETSVIIKKPGVSHVSARLAAQGFTELNGEMFRTVLYRFCTCRESETRKFSNSAGEVNRTFDRSGTRKSVRISTWRAVEDFQALFERFSKSPLLILSHDATHCCLHERRRQRQ